MNVAAQRIALGLWAALMLVVGSFLLARHLLTLPAPPATDPQLASALQGTGRGRWLALHVLYAECDCSSDVLAHLLGRPARRDLLEKIVLVGAGDEGAGDIGRKARSKGYAFEALTPEELHARYHIDAAPLLVVAGPDGAPRYVGGYTERKRGPQIRDAEVFAALLAGRPVAPLPTFGCAVSEELRAAIDPLGLSSPGPRTGGPPRR